MRTTSPPRRSCGRQWLCPYQAGGSPSTSRTPSPSTCCAVAAGLPSSRRREPTKCSCGQAVGRHEAGDRAGPKQRMPWGGGCENRRALPAMHMPQARCQSQTTPLIVRDGPALADTQHMPGAAAPLFLPDFPMQCPGLTHPHPVRAGSQVHAFGVGPAVQLLPLWKVGLAAKREAEVQYSQRDRGHRTANRSRAAAGCAPSRDAAASGGCHRRRLGQSCCLLAHRICSSLGSR